VLLIARAEPDISSLLQNLSTLRRTLERKVRPNVTLRHRPAREIAADPHFDRLLTALEAATSPVIPRHVLRAFFDLSDGSVGDVLEAIIDACPQMVSIEALLEDAHWVGALDQAQQTEELELQLAVIKAELEAVRADLSRWDTFMERSCQPTDHTRPGEGVLRSVASSTPERRSADGERHEHVRAAEDPAPARAQLWAATPASHTS
jgi:hypothetical protein